MRKILTVFALLLSFSLGSSFLLWKYSALATAIPAQNPFFEDTFDGALIDSTKWNTTFATSGLRWCPTTVQLAQLNPGNWQDASSIPCSGVTQGPPYGSVSVEGGVAKLSSFSSRTFPYVWRGPPSRSSTFPSSGDFALEVRVKYDLVTISGDGFIVTSWANTDPIGNNPPAGEVPIFGVWADSRGVFTELMGRQFFVYDSANLHDYVLEYAGGTYSLLIDGLPALGPVASSTLPNTIWFGNPVFAYYGVLDWSGFSLDLVRVTVPTISADPGSGALGTKVVVKGSGFPSVLGTGTPEVLVSFDDVFLGFALQTNDTFTFTFNVPHAEPGLHVIKALNSLVGSRGETSFLVTVSEVVGDLKVALEVGSVYFPGDTAVIYVMVTQSGRSVVTVFMVQLNMTRPDGVTVQLSTVPVGSGLTRATYGIPRAGSSGTYALVARASLSDGTAGFALQSFEVKPSWLTAQGPVISAAAFPVAITIGLVGLAWHRGFFGKRHNGLPAPPKEPSRSMYSLHAIARISSEREGTDSFHKFSELACGPED